MRRNQSSEEVPAMWSVSMGLPDDGAFGSVRLDVVGIEVHPLVVEALGIAVHDRFGEARHQPARRTGRTGLLLHLRKQRAQAGANHVQKLGGGTILRAGWRGIVKQRERRRGGFRGFESRELLLAFLRGSGE